MSPDRLLTAIFLFVCAFTAQGGNADPAERADSAMSYFEAGNLPAAERCFREALAAQPGSRGNAMLLFNLGMVQAEQRKYPEALQSFDVALAIAPGSSYILSRRGATLLSLNRTKEALADFSRALEIDSTLTLPRSLRAMTLMKLSDYPAAESDIRILIRANQEDDALLASLATCREMQSDRNEAESLLSRAIGIKPEPDYYFNLTRMYLVDEEIDKARATITDAIISFPDEAALYVLRGYIHRKRYLNSEAEADRKIAIRLGAPRFLLDLWLPEK